MLNMLPVGSIDFNTKGFIQITAICEYKLNKNENIDFDHTQYCGGSEKV
jgi:hypothetical protein